MKKLLILLILLHSITISEQFSFKTDTMFTYMSGYPQKDKAHKVSIQRIKKHFIAQSVNRLSQESDLTQREDSLLKTTMGYLVLSNKGFFSTFDIHKSEWKDTTHKISVTSQCNSSIISQSLPLITQLADSAKAISARQTDLAVFGRGGYFTYLTYKDGTSSIGHLFFKNGLYKQAITEYKRVIQDYPDTPLGYKKLGASYAKLQNDSLSLNYYNTALEIILKNKPQKEKSNVRFYPYTKYEHWELEVVELLTDIAQLHKDSHKPQKAIATYCQIIENYSKDSYGKTIESLLSLTIAERVESYYSKTLEIALNNIRIFPSFKRSGVQGGTLSSQLKLINKLYIISKRTSEIPKLMDKYLHMIKNKASLLNSCAWNIYEEKDSLHYNMAVDYVSQAIVHKGIDPTPYYDTRGRLYYELKDTMKAIKDLNHYIRTSPINDDNRKYISENIEIVKKLGGTPAEPKSNEW